MQDDDQAIVIEPPGKVKKAVIWLHGLGADGSDFLPIVHELQLNCRDAVRFVFPHAPVMPVSINGGMAMRAWYDIQQADLSRRVDAVGIMQSVETTARLISEQHADGLEIEDIVLAGFSQGGVIALQTALQLDLPLAGVVALSCYLPLRDSIGNGQAQRVFLAHGTDDGVVPYQQALLARDWLNEQGHQLSWHDYPMMHSVCAEEIDDLSRWLNQVLG